MTHLWEVDHDHYGPEGSYWANWEKQRPYVNQFDSWAEFVADNGMYSALMGLNMIYRWDWHDYRKNRAEWPDEYDTDFVFEVFWMMPRKGIMARSVIKVTPDDEEAVRTWLAPHAEYMAGLWAPLTLAHAPEDDDVPEPPGSLPTEETK